MANINALKNQAVKLVVRGKYAKALEIYEKVKEMDPDEPGVYNLIGDVYLKMGKTKDAISQFKQALGLYKKVQYYPNAIAVCKKILRTDKEQAKVYNDLADLYVERGFIGEAVINYLEYATKMRSEGNKKEEIETYKKVIELGPFKIDIRERLVDLYIAEGEKEAAVEELERIEELLIQQGKQAKLPEIEEKLATLKIDEMTAPVEKKEEEVKREKVDIIQGYSMEELMGEGYKLEDAVKEVEEVIEDKVEEKVKGKIKEEVKLESEAKDEIPSKELSLSLEEEIEKLQEAYDNAKIKPISIENLPQVEQSDLRTVPTQWTNFEELAELCLFVNSKVEAIDYFYKAGQVYLDENNFEKAIKVFKKIVELKPVELRPRQKLIEISLKREDMEGAAEWNLDLGRCLYKKGAIKEAEKAFSRAIELTSNKKKFKDSVQEIKGEKRELEDIKVVTQSISLGELLEEEEKKSTKFKIAEGVEVEEPVTFEDLLEEFKEGVLENIEDKDFNSHYDLGITYKEMGLIDEAVIEFEKASKGDELKLKSNEMLALCFIEKGELDEAEKLIKEALLSEGHKEIEFLGLQYNLAQIYMHTNKGKEAAELFRKVTKVDKTFKDVASKLKELEERTKKQKVRAEKKPETGKRKKEKSKEKPKERVKTKRKRKISYI